MRLERVALACALCAGGVAAYAAPEVHLYQCERDVVVEAVYVNDADGPLAVITAEGRMTVLTLARSGSGSRYLETPDGVGYEWWIKGDAATLSYVDAASETSEMLLSNCMTRP